MTRRIFQRKEGIPVTVLFSSLSPAIFPSFLVELAISLDVPPHPRGVFPSLHLTIHHASRTCNSAHSLCAIGRFTSRGHKLKTQWSNIVMKKYQSHVGKKHSSSRKSYLQRAKYKCDKHPNICQSSMFDINWRRWAHAKHVVMID